MTYCSSGHPRFARANINYCMHVLMPNIYVQQRPNNEWLRQLQSQPTLNSLTQERKLGSCFALGSPCVRFGLCFLGPTLICRSLQLGLQARHCLTCPTPRYGCGSKLSHQGTAGFSLWFHLPGFHFGYLFLTHSHTMLTHSVFQRYARQCDVVLVVPKQARPTFWPNAEVSPVMTDLLQVELVPEQHQSRRCLPARHVTGT